MRAHCGRVIHKVMTAPRHCFLETKRWGEDERRALSGFELSPVMLQEEIEGPHDLRVTIVGGEALAARVSPRAGATGAVDSRLDLSAHYEPCELPADTRGALFSLMERLGLVYGAIDLKVTAEGEHVFLEVNPQGQYLYLEILTGLPITAAVAGYLAGP